MSKYDIAIGSDHGGFILKEDIKQYLESLGLAVQDMGTYDEESCDYPVFAKKVVKEILSNKAQNGILVCGTGQGMAMYANKFQGIRAVVCSDTFSAHASKEHNNSNILCLGQRIVGKGLALDIVKTWLNSSYEAGRHQRRLDMFSDTNLY